LFDRLCLESPLPGRQPAGTTPDRTPDSRFSLRLRDPGGHDTARATQVDKVGEAAAPHVDNRLAPTAAHLRGDERPTYWPPVGRGTRRSVTRTRPRVDALSPARTVLWGAAAAPSEPLTRAPCSCPGRLPRAAPPSRSNTGVKLRSSSPARLRQLQLLVRRHRGSNIVIHHPERVSTSRPHGSVRATRKPMIMLRSDGGSPLRLAERTPAGELLQLPPRSTRRGQSAVVQARPSVGAPS
jgi:hypothetical protein